jgi:hypothetical protein
MCKETHNLHQSGEQVAVTGIYALVDTAAHEKQQKVFEFGSGQLFPDYEGRAVCWFMVTAREETHKKRYSDEAPISTPWQSNNHGLKLH